MSDFAHTHHEVTSDTTARNYNDVGPTDRAEQITEAHPRSVEGGSQWQKDYSSGNDPSAAGYSNFDRVARGDAVAESGERRSSVVNGVETDLDSARRASLANLEERRKSSLSSTPGPFNDPTTDQVSKKGVPPSSSVGSQNAPTKAGERAESIVGGMGFGGAQVERAKQDQGIAEKIVNLMGA